MTDPSLPLTDPHFSGAADRGFHVLDLLSNPCWHASPDGQCDWVNSAWLAYTGRTMEQECGDGWTESVHPNDRESCLANWRERSRVGQSFQFEYRLRRHDGTYRWISSSGNPEFDGTGEIKGYFGCCHDINDRKVAEIRLLREQQFINTILDSTEAVIVACDHTGRLIVCNRAQRELSGLAVEPIPPEGWSRHYKLLDPASGEPLPFERVPLYRALNGEKVIDQEIDVIDADGRRHRMVCRACALHGPEGELLGAALLAKDVTAQREALAQRRRDHATRRVIADILAISFDTASLQTKLERALGVILRDGCLPVGEGFRCELRLSVDGGIAAEAAMAGASAGPTLSGNGFPIVIEGKAIGTLLVAMSLPCDPDLHELFETITVLLASMIQHDQREERITQLSRVVEQNNAGILITDAAGTILYANPALCRIRGYLPEEVIGAKPSLFKSGKIPEAVYRELWATILGGEDWSGELLNRRKDGSMSWERITISPIRDCDGKVINFVANCEDLTLVKRMQQEREALASRLNQAEKMEAIGHLAGGIAHDFNNILVAILGFNELAKKEFGSHIPKLGAYLDHSLRAGLRAKDLVAQLLAFSRNNPVDAGPLLPGPIVGEVVKLLRSTITSSLSITLSMPEELPHVQINPTQLHQVMMNLCINARDATRGRGRLDVELREARGVPETYCASCHKGFGGDYIAIVVRDNGVGIPEAERDRIFEPFFTTKEVGAGTGMGLSVVHGIVHFNGGHVTLSTPAGGGAEFAIYLPIVPALEEQSKAIRSLEVGPQRGRVLIVDDESDVAEFAREVLEGIGCQVTTRTDSLAAWDLFSRAPQDVDLVISDQTMPNLTGLELCGRMLAFRPGLPIILWTGFSTEVNENSAASFGISRFMLKPVSAGNLISAVAELLSEKEKRLDSPAVSHPSD